MTNPIFLADEGAVYILSTGPDGATSATATRSHVTYTSPDTSLTVTGRDRSHARVGWGARAVLDLDTGEGMSRMRGIVRRQGA